MPSILQTKCYSVSQFIITIMAEEATDLVELIWESWNTNKKIILKSSKWENTKWESNKWKRKKTAIIFASRQIYFSGRIWLSLLNPFPFDFYELEGYENNTRWCIQLSDSTALSPVCSPWCCCPLPCALELFLTCSIMYTFAEHMKNWGVLISKYFKCF